MSNRVLIRKASLEDVRGIVETYCSGIGKWYRIVNGEKIEASYEELSIFERWSHGGPWMTIETCSIHLNYVIVNNQYPLVAVLDDKIVGELELYIGYEKGLLGRHGYIDVLEVHKNYRGRGIGRSLVEKAVEIARENNCETIAVWPDPNAIGFYKKIGLNQILYNIKYVEIYLENIEPIDPSRLGYREFPEEYSVLENWYFVSPRIESSYVAWLKSRWDYAVELEKTKSYEAYIEPDTVFIMEEIWGEKDTASLYLWIRDKELLEEILNTLLGIAKHYGFKALRILVSNEIYREHLIKYKHSVVRDYIVLYKRIK